MGADTALVNSITLSASRGPDLTGSPRSTVDVSLCVERDRDCGSLGIGERRWGLLRLRKHAGPSLSGRRFTRLLMADTQDDGRDVLFLLVDCGATPPVLSLMTASGESTCSETTYEIAHESQEQLVAFIDSLPIPPAPSAALP